MLAAAAGDVRIALVGLKDVLDRTLAQAARVRDRIEPVEATQVVGMAESPTGAWRDKQDSSIAVGLRLVKERRADAFVSAGNTGAIAAAAIFTLGVMDGIERPALGALYRTRAKSLAIALDVGANAECRPHFLVQFAQMGSDFMTHVFKVERPRVGLVSNGEEESKGPRLVKEAHQLLKQTDLHFIGNIEGSDIFRGVADVVVMDGFTGNVALKLSEGLVEALFLSLKDALDASLLAKVSKPLWGPPVKGVVRQWATDAGALLLGVNGNVIIGHGRSTAADIKNAIDLAARMAREGWLAAAARRNLQPSAAHLTN